MGRVSYRDANNYKLLVNRELKFVKKQYFDLKFNECSNNIRKTWKLLNSLMCRGKSCKDIVLNINGVDCSDSALISNHFNSYFSLQMKLLTIFLCPMHLL